MNKENLLKGLVVAMWLASPIVSAQPEYPPDFEPKVLYQDPDLISKHVAQKPQSPAPKVVAPALAAPAPAKTAPEPKTSAAPAPLTTPAGEPSGSSNLPILFAGLAVAGIVFWASKRASGKGAQMSSELVPASAVASTVGATSVAQYMDSMVGGVETGVSKYVKSLPAIVVSQTGVSKYLRSLPPPVVAGPEETGVTKYIKGLPKPPVLPTDETGVTKYLKSL